MTKTKLSDSSLISLYKKGNEEAFSFLVNKYSSKVFSAVYLIVKDKYISELTWEGGVCLHVGVIIEMHCSSCVQSHCRPF